MKQTAIKWLEEEVIKELKKQIIKNDLYKKYKKGKLRCKKLF